MGTVPYEDALKALSPGDQAYVKAKSAEMIEEIRTLQDIRKELGLTQSALAETLEISQKNVSTLESRHDMKLSTLRSYLHALGGELVVSARFPGQNPRVIESLSDGGEA